MRSYASITSCGPIAGWVEDEFVFRDVSSDENERDMTLRDDTACLWWVDEEVGDILRVWVEIGLDDCVECVLVEIDVIVLYEEVGRGIAACFVEETEDFCRFLDFTRVLFIGRRKCENYKEKKNVY